ncbi:MBL fold metallo-hydrolase [Desemzia sp. FAM 23991]|uniref:MBL fold metallo-hydrolase n=1 Tax=unclassified Desemzia TaxID=2685243 RepID=UPI003886AB18
MDLNLYYGKDYKSIPMTSIKRSHGKELTPDVYVYTVQFVNLYLIGDIVSDDFVIVDAGTPNKADDIISAVEERFGRNSTPKAIILTHGHFDHVGSVIELVHHWNIPVYAHKMELPYLTGKKSYAKGDSTVEGGLIAKMSGAFPIEPINLGSHIHPLPEDGTVPYLSDFKWIHVPGHTEGQIALFRDKDRLLIAADAFVTTKQDSLYHVVTQKKELSGPPRYLTPDWTAAKESVRKLASLNPYIAITGHGPSMEGSELKKDLNKLADNFDEAAVPNYGKFVDDSSESQI